MDHNTNDAGYFIVLSLEDCPGCNSFKKNVEPALLKILPQSMGYVRIDVARSGKTPAEYSNLFALRESSSYPGIAWSPTHPKNVYSSRDIHWFSIDRTFTLSQLVAWLKNTTPASVWEEPVPTPSVSTGVPKASSVLPIPNTSEPKPYSPSKTAGAVFGNTTPSTKYGFYGY